LRDEILSGHATREQKIAICTDAGSLAPQEHIEILAILAADSDESIREAAARTLQAQPLPIILKALARADAAPQMFAYCAGDFSRRPGVADALAKNLSCPIEVLRTVVRFLSVTGVQDLFEDLDRLSTSPPLVEALIASTVINAEQRVQLLDLEREELDAPEAFVQAAEAAEPDVEKRTTLLQKFSTMRVVERVQRAIKGSRDERGLLIRDPCRVVQRAVLQSSQLTEREVESFAGMASLGEEALRMIATNRKYRKNYTIVRALMFNPKTPLEITLHLLPTVKGPDLKVLITNKNVPETLRTTANRLQRQRSAPKE
jgi:hypothetical protein